MSSQQQPLTVGSRFGPYRLDRLIGRGGMGEVFQAYDTVKDRTVAIKVLPERLAQDPVYRQRFQRESHAAARLREAHVIPIHDYGEIDGRLYIDMRLVEGDSLRELLRRFGAATPERSVMVVEQVAAALDAAHGEGLLHRDVKPDNIILTRDDFAYLVDFGIAQSVSDESLTSDGSAVGSFSYMAPERFSSRDFGPSSDVYALACVLYESLTGTRPFTGGTDAQMMSSHLFDAPPRPSRARAGVPESFDQVIATGLAKNPNQRYRSAGDLAAAARAALDQPRTESPGVQADSRQTTMTGPTAVTTPAPPVQVSTPPPTQIPTPPPTPIPDPVEPPRQGHHRARSASIIAACLILIAAATGFAAWAYTQQTTPGTPVTDSLALRGADIELLSLVNAYGHKRNNCRHIDTDSTTVAVITCYYNPLTDEPLTVYRKFRSAQDLQTFYKTYVLGVFTTDACGVNSTDRDIPSKIDDREVGRMACWDDLTVDPSSPVPTLAVTNTELLTMAVHFYESPDLRPIRDYLAKNDYVQFRTQQNTQDPDAYTDEDRALFSRLGSDYTYRNCIHFEPAAGDPMNAQLGCGTTRGNPAVYFLGYPDQSMGSLAYQSHVAQSPGHACGGAAGSDDVWRLNGEIVGRFTCYTNKIRTPPRQCIMGQHDSAKLSVVVCSLDPDSPENGPKTEAELLTWFRKKFG
ncbi:serine/threonine-protein kinase [Nocardia huaxiensis]|uniref:serine/threonine-protein kinase n=1 Tax=Nocardia huaxiensis TaxID=2755382 RepID=UPI001E2E32BB|nr:serine/threonine-protein kinase [Nocardia huaxiensis]UFS96017.1 serine/threonine protein kinase [Nocardia huaxiensis]